MLSIMYLSTIELAIICIKSRLKKIIKIWMLINTKNHIFRNNGKKLMFLLFDVHNFVVKFNSDFINIS